MEVFLVKVDSIIEDEESLCVLLCEKRWRRSLLCSRRRSTPEGILNIKSIGSSFSVISASSLLSRLTIDARQSSLLVHSRCLLLIALVAAEECAAEDDEHADIGEELECSN
jgi:hypothetical protein